MSENELSYVFNALKNGRRSYLADEDYKSLVAFLSTPTEEGLNVPETTFAQAVDCARLKTLRRRGQGSSFRETTDDKLNQIKREIQARERVTIVTAQTLTAAREEADRDIRYTRD